MTSPSSPTGSPVRTALDGRANKARHTIAELLPCPFCGCDKPSADGCVEYSKSHEGWWEDGTQALKAYFVNCTRCGARRTGIFGGQQTREKAIAAWNTRAESAK